MRKLKSTKMVRSIFGEHNAKPVKYESETYPSLAALARELRTSDQLLRYYLRNEKEFGGYQIKYA